jgi:HAE1 family hydrophobic/amphiphilic exporter-1
MQLVNRAGLPHEDLMKARGELLDLTTKDQRVVRVRANGLDDVPEYRLNIDWDKAGMLGVPINSIHRTVSAAFGSAYVNDFVQNNRVKRVIAQAEPEDRMLPQDINKLYVRNDKGKMVPFSAFSEGHWDFGPQSLERFNGFPSISIIGEPAAGQSSGEAMSTMESLVAKLPAGVGVDWAGLSFQERQSGSQAPFLYAFSILVIFLCLAALYESWPIPISILLALPLGIIGGIIATSVRGFPNDVYFQIGLLTTLGLTTKNAILIVQFAKARADQGQGLIEATIEASKLRLRPILMTSLAFGFGVLPLAIASGAGAGAQQAIGTSVIGGVITSTFLVTIFAPLFFVIIERLFGKKDKANGNGNKA